MHTSRENGFTHIIVLLLVVVIVVVGGIGWRMVADKQEQSQSQTQQGIKDKPVAQLSAEEQEALKAKNGNIPPTAETTPSVATTKTEPPKPVDNKTAGARNQTQQTAPVASSTGSASQTTVPTPPTAPAVLRPTAEFCAQKNGASFTNVWFTGTGTYTYDGYNWESGYSYSLPRVSKTESGTPLRNIDSMQMFDVVAYAAQPQWATCSQKAGYIMVYYSVPNSPYTFNALAEYGHVSLQQP